MPYSCLMSRSSLSPPALCVHKKPMHLWGCGNGRVQEGPSFSGSHWRSRRSQTHLAGPQIPAHLASSSGIIGREAEIHQTACSGLLCLWFASLARQSKEREAVGGVLSVISLMALE